MSQLGVDLGTTNTVACYGGDVLGIGEDGAGSLPSVVAFLPNGSTTCGQAARRRRALDGPNTLFSTKRVIGRRFDEQATREFRERYPFEVIDDGDDRPLFVTRAGRSRPTDIAAMLLRCISEPLSGELGGLNVVITVPTGFTDAQRDATLEAAQAAGFSKPRLVDESLATAEAYYTLQGIRGRVAVYDLGGGTFDVSVVDARDESLEVLAQATDPFLGGDDIDRALADWVRNEILKGHNWDLTNYRDVEIRLLAECEQAKIRLASETETRIDLGQVDPECPAAEEGLLVRRTALDKLSLALVQRSFLACDAALAQAGVDARELDAVLLAGGATLLPMVQDGVAAYFGQKGRLDFDPTEVVARGASLSPA